MTHTSDNEPTTPAVQLTAVLTANPKTGTLTLQLLDAHSRLPASPESLEEIEMTMLDHLSSLDQIEAVEWDPAA
jgi:hypothetical protein